MLGNILGTEARIVAGTGVLKRLQLQLQPFQICRRSPTCVLGAKVFNAKRGWPLNKPARPLPSFQAGRPPIRFEMILPQRRGSLLQRAVLPLGTAHDVVIIIAEHIRLDAELSLNPGIVVGIVGDVADVKNPERSPHSSLEVVDQTQCACVFSLDRACCVGWAQGALEARFDIGN